MAAESLKTIRVFCHEHGRVFQTQAKPQILCSISKHILAGDFPRGEVWEFCCDCNTFFPSKLGKGETARKDCPVCNRQVTRRYLCHSCSTVSFESDEPPEGKQVSNINYVKGIAPFCQACQTSSTNTLLHEHQCEKIAAELLTGRENCLLCKKKLTQVVSEQITPVEVIEEPKKEVETTGLSNKGLITCPNPACRRKIPATSGFCGFCGIVLFSNETVEDSETRFQAKTLLFGSFCPKCNAVSLPEDKFCKECGQALKSLLPPRVEHEPVKISVEPTTIDPIPSPDEQIPPIKTTNNSLLAVIGCGGVILFIGLLIAIAVSNSTSSSSNNANANVNSPYNTSNYNLAQNNSNPSNSYKNNVVMNSYTPMANANKPINSSTPSNSSNLSSSQFFKRTYEGKINYTNEIEMKLERSGDSLSGKVIPLSRSSTLITVSGTIEDDDSFEMYEYDDQDNITGIYQGRIYPSGRIEGTWSKPDGSKEYSFYLSQK